MHALPHTSWLPGADPRARSGQEDSGPAVLSRQGSRAWAQILALVPAHPSLDEGTQVWQSQSASSQQSQTLADRPASVGSLSWFCSCWQRKPKHGAVIEKLLIMHMELFTVRVGDGDNTDLRCCKCWFIFQTVAGVPGSWWHPGLGAANYIEELGICRAGFSRTV